jgi:hypothetical protein
MAIKVSTMFYFITQTGVQYKTQFLYLCTWTLTISNTQTNKNPKHKTLQKCSKHIGLLTEKKWEKLKMTVIFIFEVKIWGQKFDLEKVRILKILKRAKLKCYSFPKQQC